MARPNQRNRAERRAIDQMQKAVQAGVAFEASFTQAHSGPLPPPEQLAQYEQIQAGLVERIVSMAERESAHRQSLEAMVVKGQLADLMYSRKQTERGQRYGYGVAIVGLMVAGFCAYVGAEKAAGIIGGSTLVALVTAFVLGRWPLKQSSPDDEEKPQETLPEKSDG